MAIEKTLQRVDALLEAGDLAGARERLRSLVAYAPRRLDLRERLADVYLRAGDPQQAGRWGYLSEQTTQAELQAFTRNHRGDARSMMHALRWEGTAPAPGPWWEEAVGLTVMALVLACVVVGAVTIVRCSIGLVF